ncbi:nidogen-like domain-containing protein [Halomonas sp. LS-001]
MSSLVIPGEPLGNLDGSDILEAHSSTNETNEAGTYRMSNITNDLSSSMMSNGVAFSGTSLLSGLGGEAGFGENILPRNDDSSTAEIDISQVFENGINFFGREFNSLWVNNNGSVTFNGARSAFTPSVITENSGNPEITPFFADVDTRGGEAEISSAGGNSTGSNLVYYDFDTVNDRFIVTWDDVGYFSRQTDKLNAFQLILSDRGQGDFDIEFRYENVEWTTGSASGGTDGLGGQVARAGYTAGTGDPDAFFELPASGDQEAILALDEVEGNTGQIGQWLFPVRSGDIVSADIPPLPDPAAAGAVSGDPHLVTLDGLGYDFQAVGEYVLSRGAQNSDFEIQARFVPIGDNASATSAVATSMGNVDVMIDATSQTPILVDGVETTVDDFSSIAVGDDRIYREDNRYTFVYAGEDGVVNEGDSRLIVDLVNDRVDFQVRLNEELAGSVEGLLGDGDGDTSNDVALEDGTVLERPFAFEDLYGEYRDDWRVSNEGDSLFSYAEDESLEGFYDESHPNSIISVDDLDPETRAEAEQLASDAGLTPGTVSFNNAVLDYGLTGDNSFIDSAVSAPRVATEDFIEVSPPEDNDELLVAADFNNDGAIDVDDLLIFREVFGADDFEEGTTEADADLDDNGAVDVDDLLIFRDVFGQTVDVSETVMGVSELSYEF